MVRHEAGARAEDGEIAAALLHLLELVADDALAQLVVADLELADLRHRRGILDARDLPVAPILKRLRRRRVVAVHVDDQFSLLPERRPTRSVFSAPLAFPKSQLLFCRRF